jgi:hypothetical protein
VVYYELDTAGYNLFWNTGINRRPEQARVCW